MGARCAMVWASVLEDVLFAAARMLGTRKLQGLAERRIGPGFARSAADGEFQCEQWEPIAKLYMRGAQVARSAFLAAEGHSASEEHRSFTERPGQYVTSQGGIRWTYDTPKRQGAEDYRHCRRYGSEVIRPSRDVLNSGYVRRWGALQGNRTPARQRRSSA